MDRDAKGYAEIYNKLPIELQKKISYYVLEHPIAMIIKEKIKELRCNEYYTIRDSDGKLFCKIDGKDYFSGQYFLKFKKKDDTDHTDSETSDEYLDVVFERMLFVSSSSSSEDEE